MEEKTFNLSDDAVAYTIDAWDALKPTRPSTPQPLFVWPNSPLVGLLRSFPYAWKLKRSGWLKFQRDYQAWVFRVMRHYNQLADMCTESDWMKNPQLKKLWDYEGQAEQGNRENIISQDDWNKQKQARKNPA